MLKKRLVLSLLMDGDDFMNSRQFELQRVAKLDTVMQYLDFDAIDELVVLNVARGEHRVARMAEAILPMSRHCFVPMTLGGGVRELADFGRLFACGADKIVVNTAALARPDFITEAASVYGSQCVVVSIDVRLRSDKYEVLAHGGADPTAVA